MKKNEAFSETEFRLFPNQTKNSQRQHIPFDLPLFVVVILSEIKAVSITDYLKSLPNLKTNW